MRRGVIRRNTLYSKGVWGKKRHRRSFPGGSEGKESACNAGDHGSISGSRIKPVKGMATHSSILAWRIPWIEEPGGLQSTRSQRVRHNWATNVFTLFIFKEYCFQ